MTNWLFAFAVLVCALWLSDCATAVGAPALPPAAPAVTPVTVVMSYVPNIQFSPFYVAEKKGYFAQEGLKLNYNWGLEYDGVKLVGAGQADFALVGGDQIIQARAQGIPLVYVANWYHAYPVVIFSLAEKNIKSPQDLLGKKVGLQFYGTTYTAWRGLLYSQKIDESKIQTQDIGFTQVQAVSMGVVDAASGYANNEPVQMALAGKPINVIKVWEHTRLIGNGLAANERSLQERPAVVQAMVRALLRGIQDVIANPEEALEISAAAVPEIGGEKLETSRRVLQASIELWKSPRVGYSSPEDWQAMAHFMLETGLVKQPVDAAAAFTNRFIP